MSFKGPSRRIKRSVDKTLWEIIRQIKRGMEKIVDGYVYYTLRGINNAIRDKKNAHKTINSIVSDTIEDIDNRLNKPPKTTNTEG